jgi:uncharacterized membrane protein YdjX (TVP38/TMEM64 family)
VGRAGGELFVLKRINRARYEQMRDRFERQEFMAIMIPSMMPPPTPVKLFEFGAGVFEMKPLLFATAVFSGKFIQFLVCALITVFYGPEIAHTIRLGIREHPAIMLGIVGVAVVGLTVYILRKLLDRRNPELPEDDVDAPAEDQDSTLIT